MTMPKHTKTMPQPLAPQKAATGPTNEMKMHGLVQEMEDDLLLLKRTMAGYAKLQAAFKSASDKSPNGRPAGLPVFEFVASLAGPEEREPVRCAIDLKDVDPAYLSHVLIPILNVQSSKLGRVLSAMQTKLERLSTMVDREVDNATDSVPYVDAPGEYTLEE